RTWRRSQQDVAPSGFSLGAASRKRLWHCDRSWVPLFFSLLPKDGGTKVHVTVANSKVALMRCRTQYPSSHGPAIRRWIYAIITASFGLGLALLGVESALQIKERLFDNSKEVAGAWKKANALQSSGIDVYPLLVPSMFILAGPDHISIAGGPVADRL